MAIARMRELVLLWCRIRSNRVALVGGNHTAARSVIFVRHPSTLWKHFVVKGERHTIEMDLGRGYCVKNEIKTKKLKSVEIGMNSDTLLSIKLPDPRVLLIISRSLFLAMIILTWPTIECIIKGSSSALYDSDVGSDLIDLDWLPIVLHDLADEGLLKKGQKCLILSSDIGALEEVSEFLNDYKMNLVIGSDLDRLSSTPDETFDFVFTTCSFQDSESFDRILKIGGIVVMQLSDNPSNQFQPQPNYKFVYLHRFDSTVVALRKTDGVYDSVNPPTKRRLCGTKEAKKAALEGLENVLLEPPRRPLAKSSNGSRKIKFLPDLLRDSLESYQRRIFITDEKPGVLEWFHENYPMRNQYFEIYRLGVKTYDTRRVDKESVTRMAPRLEWSMKNLREEDYVVMKAEAQLVEEMIEKRTICLVDELFLECTNQWQGDEEENESKRAYWQCLTLYGKLRDEGVAVHQWWG
ncbi:unnamed protein product [Ilex paraguariensis]|uniref:DUF7870 domain-containing protein n=1 Tax=Ilex paraguariensis TaxID=185542 RepID=A0ABC8T146_9AQUA